MFPPRLEPTIYHTRGEPPGLELTIYHTRGEHANQYTTVVPTHIVKIYVLYQ
jgi:hypothetical protein